MYNDGQITPPISMVERNIRVNDRVEISPHFDLWMMGAMYGTVRSLKNGTCKVKLDRWTKLQSIATSNLKRV